MMKLFNKHLGILGLILGVLVVASISITIADQLKWTSVMENDMLWQDITDSLKGHASTGSYSILNNSSKKNISRFFIRGTELEELEDDEKNITIKYDNQTIGLVCNYQLNGFYYNEKIVTDKLLPLNQEMFAYLPKNLALGDTFTIDGGFYTDCRDVDSGAIFGSIKYSLGESYLQLLAGVDIDGGALVPSNSLFLRGVFYTGEDVLDQHPQVTSIVGRQKDGVNLYGDDELEGEGTPKPGEEIDIFVYGEFFDSIYDESLEQSKSSVVLVQFENFVIDDWSETGEVELQWYNGATGGWWLSDENNVTEIPDEKDYTGVTEGSVSIELDTSMNGKYICAFGIIGEDYRDIICSENEVRIKTVGFTKDVPSNWSLTGEVGIQWQNGSTGGWWFSDSNSVSSIPDEEDYTGVTEGSAIIELASEMNGTYVCAFGRAGEGDPQIICSDNEIKIDDTNPDIQLLYPTSELEFALGDSIDFVRSGLDDESGISGYLLSVNGTPYGEDLILTTGIENYYLDGGIGTWEWNVLVFDNAGNTAAATGSFTVSGGESGHGSAPVYVQFGTSSVPSMWSHDGHVDIEWLQGAVGGWWLSTNNNLSTIPETYTEVTSGAISIELTTSMNGKYVYAFGVVGDRYQIIHSSDKVKIDNENPEIDILSPANGTEFNSGASVQLRWSGSDSISGISGYILNLNNLSGSTTFTYALTNTMYNYTVSEAGNWERRVKVCDYAGLCAEKSGNFVVVYTGQDIDTTGGFYLIRPALWDRITLGNNITFMWNPGSVNSGYIWEITQIGESGVYISGSSNTYSVVVDGGRFATGSYSWSVYDVASENIEEVPLFYIVENGHNPDLKVDQFEFDDEKYAEADEIYSSNIIEIDGMTEGWYTLATLKDNKGVLWINGVFAGSQGYVTNGDEVYIELKASSRRGETVTATLLVGTGDSLVSGSYKVTTDEGVGDWDSASLTPLQKLWGVIFVDSLVEMYQYDEGKLATFLSTFMQILEDKIEEYDSLMNEAQEDGDDDLEAEYKLYKNALTFLYTIVEYRYNDIEVEDRMVYVAPNGRQYEVEYDEERMAYTSPDFATKKYFPTWEAFTSHIDKNNPAAGSWGMVGNIITTHNGKVYMIYETNGKWTSSNFKTAKYFDTKEDIVNHILANNPASNWDHVLDTDFIQVSYTAPNGKVYKIFKTSSEGHNPDMYSSYDFIDAKYFTSLDAAKKFIRENNKK